MRTRTVCLTLLGLLPTAALAEEPARVSGPVLGFVLERESASVRPILGVPGAALMGASVTLGIDVNRAALSSRADFVLAVLPDTGQVSLFRNLGGPPSPVLIENAAPAPDGIILSPDGTAAALYYSTRNAVQVLAGLPENAAVHRELDLSGVPAPISVLAVSDDGESVLVSSRTEESDSLFLVRSGGAPQYLVSAGRVSAAAFFPGSADLVFADASANTVYGARDIDGQVAVTPIAGERDGIANPVAVQVSSGSRRVFVAGSGPGTVAIIDLNAVSGAEPQRPGEPFRAGNHQREGDPPGHHRTHAAGRGPGVHHLVQEPGLGPVRQCVPIRAAVHGAGRQRPAHVRDGIGSQQPGSIGSRGGEFLVCGR